MIGLLQTIAAAPAEKALFADGGRAITAGQIRQTAASVASRLSGAERIYLHTKSASLFTAGLFAAWRNGSSVCCPAHVHPHYLGEIGVDKGVLLTDQDVDVPSALPIALAAGEDPASKSDAHDLDLIFYTSGVTGVPKQIHKKIAQLDSEAWTLEEVWGRRAAHTIATVSHQHIYGMLFRVFWPVLSGRVSEDRAGEYWENVASRLSEGATLISSPGHLTRLPPRENFKAPAPGLIFSSGAPLAFEAAQAASDLFGSLPIEVLGSTETGGIAWRQQSTRDALWTPLPNVEIAIGEDGALGVTSPFVSGDGAVATGDLAERAGDKFRLKGRSDRVVKIEGKRVSLARVEEGLLSLPIIAAAASVDLPHRKGALGAIVELNADGQSALQAQGAFRLSRNLRAALADRLEPAERPKYWRFSAIPLDSQGKRVQAMLRAQFESPADDRLGQASAIALDGDIADVALELLPDLIWFKGHFPDQPVMPGVAQIHVAALWAERLWNWRPGSSNVVRLKFRRIIRPGDNVHLKLVRQPEKQRLKFTYQLGDIVASEGTIGGDE